LPAKGDNNIIISAVERQRPVEFHPECQAWAGNSNRRTPRRGWLQSASCVIKGPGARTAAGRMRDGMVHRTRGTDGRTRRLRPDEVAVLEAWDGQCAFCGTTAIRRGQRRNRSRPCAAGSPLKGPDSLDNGLAMCSLHHKLFDLGVPGLSDGLKVIVSARFSARTLAGRAVYELHGRELARGPARPFHRRLTRRGRPSKCSKAIPWQPKYRLTRSSGSTAIAPVRSHLMSLRRENSYP
jgi:hypothetical protein